MAENKNMELWNQVCRTDPDITKHVAQRGGFTAIDAQSQIRRATELWGPYGGKWGVRDCKYSIINDTKGEAIEIGLEAVFYASCFGVEIEFQLASDIAYRAGNDSRKKLLTDLTTKALSKLGFNSDVFEGKFDDNKYVQQLKAEKAAEPAQKPPASKSKPQPQAEQLPPNLEEIFWGEFARICNNAKAQCPQQTIGKKAVVERLLAKFGKQISLLENGQDAPFAGMSSGDKGWTTLYALANDASQKTPELIVAATEEAIDSLRKKVS